MEGGGKQGERASFYGGLAVGTRQNKGNGEEGPWINNSHLLSAVKDWWMTTDASGWLRLLAANRRVKAKDERRERGLARRANSV